MSAAATTAAAAPRKEEDPKDQDKKRLYVRWEVTDDTLKHAFEKFGKIAETRVVRGPRLRAFGFLTFEREEDAAKAKEQMDGKALSAGPLEIQFASAAGAVRAREKKDRKPRAAGTDAKASPADGKSGESKRGGRAARGAKANGTAAAPAKGAKGGANAESPAEGKRGARKSRRGRGRGGAAAGGAAGSAAAAPEAKRESKKDDPNWGKVVRLVPDPIKTPLGADSQLTELKAGPRVYKAGRSDAKQIATLMLNADPTKGPFNCAFQLGNFNLKLLEVKVSSRDSQNAAGQPERDVRVGCRVVHPDSNRSREVYLRVKGAEHKHKFLELRLPNPKPADGKEADLPAEVESFFVTIDSIQVDLKTSLWKQIYLSLVSMMVPRVSAARAGATDGKTAAAK